MGLSLVSGRAGEGGHTYWQDSVTHLPCAFEFVGDEKMAWFFDVDSLKTGPQDGTLFTVPETCSAHRCQQNENKEVKSAAHAGPGGAATERGAGEDANAGGVDFKGGKSNFDGLVDEVVGLVDSSSSTH